MATEILKKQTIVGTDAQYEANRNSYGEGTVFESTSLLGEGDIDPTYTNKFVQKKTTTDRYNYVYGYNSTGEVTIRATSESTPLTIPRRNDKGNISVGTPQYEWHATPQNYVDGRVAAIYAYLGQLAIGGVTVEDTYLSRVTAGGLSLLDGAPTRIHTIQGHTETWGINATSWVPEKVTKYGVTLTPDTDTNVIIFTGVPEGNYKPLIEFPDTLFEDGETYTFGQDMYFTSHTEKNAVYWLIRRTNRMTGATNWSYASTVDKAETFTFDKTLFKYTIQIVNGAYSYSSGDELEMKLFMWAVKGTVDSHPEEYYGELKSASFKGVTSTGNNIIDLYRTKITTNGLTVTCNNNIYTVSGTAKNTYQNVFDTAIPASWAGKTITLSQYPTSSDWSSTGLYMLLYSVPFQQVAATYVEAKTVTLQEGVTYRLCIRNVNNTTTDYAGKTFKFMVNFGETALPYEDYVSDTSFQLPSALTLNKWDYIDIDKQKVIYYTATRTKGSHITADELKGLNTEYILSADTNTVYYKTSTPIELDILIPKSYQVWTNGAETVTTDTTAVLPPTITQTYYEEIS